MNTKTYARFDAIQYLRAIAALMVVLFHAQSPGSFNPLKGYPATAWGVDIFFVISGFIMYAIARNESPREFLVRRIIRVVPLYWLATLTLLYMHQQSAILSMSRELVDHIVKSLFFIPHYNLAMPDNVWPYLIPAWTLTYEMFFYILFAIGLALHHVRVTVIVTITLLVIAGQLHPFSTPITMTLVNPIMLEFLMGILIASAYLTYGLPARLAWLLPIGLISLMSLPFIDTPGPILFWKIVFSSMIVLGAVAMGDRAPPSRLWNLLGDASYSIYLTHTVFSLELARRILAVLPLSGIPQFAVWVVLSLGISAIIGVLIYILIEKPVLNWLRDMWRMIGREKKSRRCDSPPLTRPLSGKDP